jgi:Tfp pilus assembly protein PilO
MKNGLTVMRMTPLPAEAADGLTAYRLSVDGTGSIEQLRSFLAEVESGLPLVSVTGFEIKPQTAGSPGEQPYPSEALAFALRLAAYGLGGAP